MFLLFICLVKYCISQVLFDFSSLKYVVTRIHPHFFFKSDFNLQVGIEVFTHSQHCDEIYGRFFSLHQSKPPCVEGSKLVEEGWKLSHSIMIDWPSF